MHGNVNIKFLILPHSRFVTQAGDMPAPELLKLSQIKFTSSTERQEFQSI